jgi:CRISPR-associated exonuclease Cas4
MKAAFDHGAFDYEVLITVSDVMEYSFCPRFVYFMHCLNISQHAENRFKVVKGREVHAERKNTNRDHVRKKLHCILKDPEVLLVSKKHHIKGIVDEVLFLEDGTAAPLEYKFAQYRNEIFLTHINQLALQAILIEENYGRKVKKGYICYIRSKNLVKEVKLHKADLSKAKKSITEILEIIKKGTYPAATHDDKCTDCCYRNICV